MLIFNRLMCKFQIKLKLLSVRDNNYQPILLLDLGVIQFYYSMKVQQGNKLYGNDGDEMQEPQREDLLMKSLKEVVAREYSMHVANWVLAGGIANANKISDEISKKYKTDDEKERIRLFTAMCNKCIELEMIYDFETLRKEFEKAYPNSKIKFAQNHFRFLKKRTQLEVFVLVEMERGISLGLMNSC